jgi:hypothetical protein
MYPTKVWRWRRSSKEYQENERKVGWWNARENRVGRKSPGRPSSGALSAFSTRHSVGEFQSSRSLGLGGVTNVGKKATLSFGFYIFICVCANRVELSHWRRVCYCISCCRLVLYILLYSVAHCVVSIDVTTRFKSADLGNFSSRTTSWGLAFSFIWPDDITTYDLGCVRSAGCKGLVTTSRPYIQILKIQLRNPLSIIEFKLPKKSSFVIFCFLTFQNLICFSPEYARTKRWFLIRKNWMTPQS